MNSRDEAIAKVRSGQAQAALIVPADIVAQIQSLITQGVGSPTVELILNSSDPLERQFANQAISARVNQVEQAVSKQVLRVAVSDLDQVLNGGTIQFLGQNVPLLGLRNARAIVQGTIAAVPRGSPLRTALGQVVDFAEPGHRRPRLRHPGARLDRHPADRPADRAGRQDHADRDATRRRSR